MDNYRHVAIHVNVFAYVSWPLFYRSWWCFLLHIFNGVASVLALAKLFTLINGFHAIMRFCANTSANDNVSSNTNYAAVD
ncbi:unnamed protein product [Toxocara canis]|uniref:TLC domain-containing protein n=1 Tax=Toxocara canis TaxID=6265 RepID=A0A183UGI9_TOXCA|nr:unnamed protein product [Toxocara canis]